jgi:hypothetical protein
MGNATAQSLADAGVAVSPEIVYFKITFPAGLAHDYTWIGTMDNADEFLDTVKVLFWQDGLGCGWGVCQKDVWDDFVKAMEPLIEREKQSVVLVDKLDVVATAVDPRRWSL